MQRSPAGWQGLARAGKFLPSGMTPPRHWGLAMTRPSWLYHSSFVRQTDGALEGTPAPHPLMPGGSGYLLALTLMVLGLASSALGMVSVSTPSLKVASALSALMGTGTLTEREKAP
jgi:hypothetical protein